jgi:hypothetical protein
MESRFSPYFKPSSKLRMGSYGRPLASARTVNQPVNSPAMAMKPPVLAWFRPNFHGLLTVRDRRAIDGTHLISTLTEDLV